MTEAEWLACDDPQRMLDHFRKDVSNRKLRLFLCACCRHVWSLLNDERCRVAVDVAEKYGNEEASERELVEAGKAVQAIPREMDSDISAADAATMGVLDATQTDNGLRTQPIMSATICAAALADYVGMAPRPGGYSDCLQVERVWHLSMFRHVTGNPFRPYSVPAAWPAAAVDLAQALYDGDDNRLILADALEEGGQLALADHFRADEWHPKGCWALDLILGKA